MIAQDIIIPKLTEELRQLHKKAMAAIHANDKAACELALNEQIKVIDSLSNLGRESPEK